VIGITGLGDRFRPESAIDIIGIRKKEFKDVILEVI